MERDMYIIIKQYLESFDFTVKAEVNDIDIMAVKNEDIILIEMKTQLNTNLMAQGIKRSALNDSVYLAIPRPSSKVIRSTLFKDKCLILKHLGLGLLLVDVKKNEVEVFLDVKDGQVRKRKKKRKALLKEFALRKTAHNVGGVSKTKIVTAYKELALLALDFMRDGEKSTKELRDYTKRKKVVDILQKNYYGWFVRVSRGVYDLTDAGRNALNEYAEVMKELRMVHNEEQQSED